MDKQKYLGCVSRVVGMVWLGAALGCAGEIGAEGDGSDGQTLALRKVVAGRGGSDTDRTTDSDGVKTTGNGAPSGAHYTLNLIGMSKEKSASLTGNSGHRIFVPLEGRTRISLSEGDFQVLDANATDGEGAFALPNPDPENDGVTEYSVYVRALGKPGGSSRTTTCATDSVSGDEYCSVYSSVVVRDRGGSKFQNVSRELLYVYADVDGDGTVERYPLFGDGLEDYYWDYDNSGLKVAQLRFYPVPTDVN